MSVEPGLIPMNNTIRRAGVDTRPKISADTLQKARETAAETRRVEEVRDEPDKEDEK